MNNTKKHSRKMINEVFLGLMTIGGKEKKG